MEEKLIQLFTDCSEQSGETYEQRSINDSDFAELAKNVVKLFARHKTQLTNGIQTSEESRKEAENKQCNISIVSVSLFEQLKMQLMYHKDKENERYKCRDYRDAMYHNHKAGAIEDVLNWIRHNER